MKQIYLKQSQLQLIRESYNKIDIDTINSVEYFINDDDEITYDVQCWDMNNDVVFHQFDMPMEDIISVLGERIAQMIANREGRSSGNFKYLENICDITLTDLTNVEEVNELAKKLFRTLSCYRDGVRGFLLTDGTIIDIGEEQDHRNICKINGMNINRFLALGNIRIGPSFVELIHRPTREQEYVLRQLIMQCRRNGEQLYVDICEYDDRFIGEYAQTITSHMYDINDIYADYIISDIDAYFAYGKMLGDSVSTLSENLNLEVAPSEVSISSLRPQNTLQTDIWDNGKLNSRIRLKLLDIADDFRSFLNLKWVKPIDIVLTGSICGYNWSCYSDIDMHIILDFTEISPKIDLVREYLDMKKNEWNNAHENLNMFGFNVECYVEHVEDKAISSGIYSLNTNEWLKKPFSLKQDLDKPTMMRVKLVTSSIMTKIDDLVEDFYQCQDDYQLAVLEKEIICLLQDIKQLRRDGLAKDGEQSIGNLSYKLLRRFGYLDKMWKLKNQIYDKINSLS